MRRLFGRLRDWNAGKVELINVRRAFRDTLAEEIHAHARTRRQLRECVEFIESTYPHEPLELDWARSGDEQMRADVRRLLARSKQLAEM
jgi:hypothetical protein